MLYMKNMLSYIVRRNARVVYVLYLRTYKNKRR